MAVSKCSREKFKQFRSVESIGEALNLSIQYFSKSRIIPDQLHCYYFLDCWNEIIRPPRTNRHSARHTDMLTGYFLQEKALKILLNSRSLFKSVLWTNPYYQFATALPKRTSWQQFLKRCFIYYHIIEITFSTINSKYPLPLNKQLNLREKKALQKFPAENCILNK